MSKITISDLDRKIGGQIKAGRTMRDMPASTLATTAGITFQQVNKYESGENRVTAARLVEIAVALQLPLSFFVGDVEGLPSDGATGLEPNAAEMVREFGKLTDKQQLAVIRFCSQLKVNEREELIAALRDLVAYTRDILTGPVMQAAGVRWPNGEPQGPVLQAARAALAKVAS